MSLAQVEGGRRSPGWPSGDLFQTGVGTIENLLGLRLIHSNSWDEEKVDLKRHFLTLLEAS
jgi:hypothetical protein